MFAIVRNSRSGVEADTAAETEKIEVKVYKSAKASTRGFRRNKTEVQKCLAMDR